MKTTRRQTIAGLTAATATTVAVGLPLGVKPVAANPSSKLSATKARELAKEAWLFGLPLVMFEKQFDYSTYATKPEKTRAPVNQFAHYRAFVDASDRSVVGFNVDNLYSFAGLDLSKEPIVLAIPKMGERFWLMQVIDAWNGVPAAPGSRSHGGEARSFLIAGPDWKGSAPKGVEVLRSPTNLVLIGGRTYCAGIKDYAEVNRLQDQYTLTPLSAWGQPYTPPTNVPLKEGVDGKTLVNEQVMALSSDQFFANLNRLMATNPPYPQDAPMLEKLRLFGVAPGASFSTSALNAEVKAAIDEGVKLAKAAMAEEIKNLGEMVNNWGLTYDMGRYGTRYTYRAAWTFAGIGGNLIEDAFYPLTLKDADGKQLAAEHDYALTFKKGALPPAEAFWSITLYDIDGYLVENPLKRYAVGDRSKMTANADGSLTIYIQAKTPGKEKESNWLPAPKSGAFKLAMRVYVPSKSVLDKTWVPPAVMRIN